MSLVSLNDYKEFARISLSDIGEDAKLQKIADETESEVKEYLNRDLELKDYVEVYDGNGSNEIILNQFPINEVSKIEFYEDEWIEGTYTRLYIDNSVIGIEGLVFTKGIQNIRISYNAGYEEVPGDIIRACKQLFTLNFQQQEGRKDLGLASVGVGAEKSVNLDLDSRDKILKRIEKFKAINV